MYCWQTMIKTGCLVLFRLAQSCAFYVKLESSCCRIKCAFQPGSIDRNLGRTFFCRIFQLSPSPLRIRVSDLLLSVYKENPKHVLCVLFREIWVPLVPLRYLGFWTQNLSKVALFAVCVNLLWDLKMVTFTCA